MTSTNSSTSMANPAKRVKLTGREFYESIGSPKYIVAPMVDRSEYAWRRLTRSYLSPQRNAQTLCYSPMLHARMFQEKANFRDAHFNPTRQSLTTQERAADTEEFLDGNTTLDRPLFVQFCANKPDELLEAAKYVAPYCDAVDLNLGCPQGIAKHGHYGAFLQEDWACIRSMISRLRDELDVPITAKMRILDTKEKTLEYARMILEAGASILTVHGRRREQKGHNMGVADWEMIKFLRQSLPKDVVLFANGNILNQGDLDECLQVTGADAIMSAEGNLSDPTIFAEPRSRNDTEIDREYWWSRRDNLGGYRVDAVMRRYLDIIWNEVLEEKTPARIPLYVPGDAIVPDTKEDLIQSKVKRPAEAEEENQAKRQKLSKTQKKKQKASAVHNPSLKALQGHLFQILRPMLSVHTDVRDALGRCRTGDMAAFENVLKMTEKAVKQGLDAEYEISQRIRSGTAEDSDFDAVYTPPSTSDRKGQMLNESELSKATRKKYGRPWWVCQPYIRPLPEEAISMGAMKVSEKNKQHQPREVQETSQAAVAQTDVPLKDMQKEMSELPKQEALACG